MGRIIPLLPNTSYSREMSPPTQLRTVRRPDGSFYSSPSKTFKISHTNPKRDLDFFKNLNCQFRHVDIFMYRQHLNEI